jgi:NADH-quinone oxidoreductase subunit F
MLLKLEKGEGSLQDIEILKEACGYMAPGNTFCALAPGAAEPLQSGLKYFMDEFVEHVNHGCKYHKH